MDIEPIWEFVEDAGACTPAVGFLMKWKGQVRYQPHLRMKLSADCQLLRYTDHRTYWGKKDIGAVMAAQADLVMPVARFDPVLVRMAGRPLAT